MDFRSTVEGPQGLVSKQLGSEQRRTEQMPRTRVWWRDAWGTGFHLTCSMMKTGLQGPRASALVLRVAGECVSLSWADSGRRGRVAAQGVGVIQDPQVQPTGSIQRSN